GKSTVGRALADRLGWAFFDLDDEIVAAEGTSIAEIFTTRGEHPFRHIESAMLGKHVSAIEAGRATVLALGGGAFTIAANRDLLANRGVSVWLDCPFDLVRRRIQGQTHRPLARDPQAFAALYEARREVYALADIRVSVECDDV